MRARVIVRKHTHWSGKPGLPNKRNSSYKIRDLLQDLVDDLAIRKIIIIDIIIQCKLGNHSQAGNTDCSFP